MATETFIIDIRTRGTKRSASDIKRIGQSASQVRKTLAFLRNALVAVAAIRVFANITSSMVEFSDQMLVVKAVTQATGQQFQALRAQAKGLGAATRFTAAEAAEGMAFLARAGLTVTEVMGTIPGVLDLAAAAQLDLGNAADIASNLMTSFRREVSEIPEVMDTLVFTANNANTTVQQLADGLKLFAPIASQLGISLKDAASFMAILGDAGIQASLAGTGLRRVITDLEAPTGTLAKVLNKLGIGFDEVRPSVVGLEGSLKRLAKEGLGASISSALFGKRGGFIAAQLLDTIEESDNFRERLEDIDGTAKRAAKTMEEGLGGALRLVRSALQNLIIAFADLGGEDFLNQFFRGLAETLRAVARNADSVWAAIKALLIVMAARKVLLFGKAMILASVALKKSAASAIVAAGGFRKAAFSAAALKTALLKIPFVAIFTAIGLMTAGFVAFRNEMKLVGEDGGTLNDVFTATGDLLANELTNAVNAVGFEFEDFDEIVSTVSSRVASGIEGMIASMFGLLAAAKAILPRVNLRFKIFQLKLEAGLFKVQSGFNKVLGALGFKSFRADLKDNEDAARSLVKEIIDLGTATAAAGTIFENFIRGTQALAKARKEATRARKAAEKEKRIGDEALKAIDDARARANAADTKKKDTDGGPSLRDILGDESGKAAAAVVERLEEALRNLEAAYFPVLAAMDAEAEVRKTIKDALDAGIPLRKSEEELVKRFTRSQLGANITIQQAAEEQEVLNQALKDTIISLAEFEFLSRKASIAFLDGQRDAASGAERAFLKLTQDASDAAKFTEMVMTDAFKSIEDAVVNFAKTGEFNINSFFQNFAEQLLRLGTQQAIAGIGSLFPSTTGSSGVSEAGGAGIGGFIAPFLTKLFGFHEGGAFTVGANSAIQSLPGMDNRLVAFKAQDGERVTVTPKNQSTPLGSLASTNIVFNVQAKDADSFVRSQSQLQNRLLAAVSQARSRR